MKRMRDDLYPGPQFKRPVGSSRGESVGQSQVPSGGFGAGGGIGGGGVMGAATGNGGGTSQKLTTNDALTYLKEVKEMFQDQREKYDMFLEVMKDFKAQRIDTAGVIARVKELFKGHNNLIYGFNTFLPKGYEITLDEDEAPPKKTVEFEEAITFVNKIKKRFQNDEHVYKSFLDILNMYRKEHKDINEVYSEVATLFEDHPDLLEEFTRFLPDSLTSSSQHGQSSRTQFLRYNDRGSGTPNSRQIHMDKRRHRIVGFPGGDRDLSVERPELDEDKGVPKMPKDHRKRVEKESKERRNRDQDDREIEQDNSRDYNSHHFCDKRKSARKAEGFEAYSAVASSADKDTLKSMCNQAFVFCEKVKERLRSQDDYQTFLKCLNIFSSGIIQRKDLQNLVSDLLGKHPDLMDEFNQFFERCENIEGFQRLAGVMSKKSFGVDEHISRPVKIEEREREQKREADAVKEKERCKEKYMAKSIQELDLSDCERCTPSYRLLPDDYPIPLASHRSELGAQVLNDHWVSVTSGSEDYSFKHMRRNQYEESLFRCEDDRFELDMLLESVISASRRAEDLLNKLNDSKINIDTSFRIEDYFTALNLRCIERLYGDHGLDVMDILRKNPPLALPVILTRLKQKQEEWTKCREDFNKVWADIYEKNHYKSLDHRSFYFKQQDSKNLGVKALVAEIKELKERMQKENDILMSIAAGYRQPITPHLEYEYSDTSIHEDLFKLVEFSCEEICSNKEQINKVLRLWTNFVEPMIGVPPRSNGAEAIEEASKSKHPTDANCAATSIAGSNAASGGDVSGANPKQSKCASNGEEHGSSTVEGSKEMDPVGKDDHMCSAAQLEKEPENFDGTEKRSGTSSQMAIDDRAAKSTVPVTVGFENDHGRTGLEVMAVSSGIPSGPKNTSNEDHQPESNSDAAPLSKGGDGVKSLTNGVLPDGARVDRYYDDSAGPSKVEKEEGELSPNGDFEEDNFGVYGNTGVKPSQQNVMNGQAVHCPDAGGENHVIADDEDSENASEAGDDASGTESAGDECSQEENGLYEEGERDEADGKAESEGEADGSADTHLIGDNSLLPQSERHLLSVKPLAKHVPIVLLDEKRKESRFFYGNDDFYVLFRLHQTLYERVLSAKTNCKNGEMKRRNPKESNSSDLYARFMSALYSLLDGSSDNTKFEDECRNIIGNQSYVLFTLDKLIYKLVKQLQAVAADEMDSKLLQLCEYEKSRRPGRLIDSVYYENARVLLHEENIYRLEFLSSPSRLSIQLMDNVIEKPEAFAVSVDPTFANYLHNDFLSVSSGKKELLGIMLKRNRRRVSRLDDLTATCNAMEGVKLINGLECKISCSSYKTSYVLDTEDVFYRKKKRRNSQRGEPTTSSVKRARLERFHRFLSAAVASR